MFPKYVLCYIKLENAPEAQGLGEGQRVAILSKWDPNAQGLVEVIVGGPDYKGTQYSGTRRRHMGNLDIEMGPQCSGTRRRH